MERLSDRWRGLGGGVLRVALLVGAGLLAWGLIAVGIVTIVALAAAVALTVLIFKGLELARRRAPALRRFADRAAAAFETLRWRWSLRRGSTDGSRSLSERPLRARRLPDPAAPSVFPLPLFVAASVVFAVLLFVLSAFGLIFWLIL